MTAKEVRQNLRRGSFIYPFVAIQVLAVAATVVEFQIGHDSPNSDFDGMLNPVMLANSGAFWIVVSVVCLGVMPMGGIILMGQELEEGNHELLLLTKLKRWKVVIGKFVSLWGLCSLTFVSLLPYVVVRYLIGGIEWTHEAACAGTILGGSAIFCAGTIGVSAFKRPGARILVLMLFLASVALGCGVPLVASAGVTGGCGWIYHITALSVVVCYTTIGLALARSRLRLSILEYEMNPGSMILGLLVFAPFVIGLITAVSVGFGGMVGLWIITAVARSMDVTPKAPKWVPAPLPNVPTGDP